MTLLFIRCFFLIVTCVVGYYFGIIAGQPLLGMEIGGLCGLLLIVIEKSLQRVSVRGLSSVVFGLLLGVLMAKLLSNILALLPLGLFIQSVLEITLIVIFSYFGSVMALRGKDEFNIIIPYVRFKRQDMGEENLLLDTSMIIDGRISEVYKTNFLKDRLIVPRFVLEELQVLADSSDENKRKRGRRGLELLRAMQADSKIDLRIHDDDLIGGQGVDAKLVTLAKNLDARICTTDFNLNRIATVQGVEILNINELAQAVKLPVFIGDLLDVKLTKEGRESSQAIANLEDGTMVVVAGGRDLIGMEVRVQVTSVLQTQAGKMIFAELVK